MNHLIDVFGSFSLDKYKKMLSNAEILLKQPRFEVFKIYKEDNPKFSYRRIWIGRNAESKVNYNVMDMGRVDGVAESTGIGNQIYSEEDIKSLK